MTPPGRRIKRKLSYDRRLLLLAFMTGLPGVVVSLVLLWTGGFTPKVQWTFTTLIIGFWWGFAFSLRHRVVMPLQTLSNIIAAIRENDFSLRARGGKRDDSLGEVMLEVNELAETLREQRLGAKVAAGDTTGLRGCIGTPEQARQYLRRYEEAGVDQVIFVLQAGRNRHEHIMESLELFGREVLPEFAERDPALSAAKAERLAPIVEAALARKPAASRDLGDYSFPAIPRQWADVSGSAEMREWLEKFADDQAAGRRDTDTGIGAPLLQASTGVAPGP